MSVSPRDGSREELGDLIESGYFKHVTRTHKYGDPTQLIECEIIVTTASIWASRPESFDPSWKVFANTDPLVIAERLIA